MSSVDHIEYARRLTVLSQEALLVEVVWIKNKGFHLNFPEPVLLGLLPVEALKSLKSHMEDVETVVREVGRKKSKERWVGGLRSALELSTFISALLPDKED